MPRLNQILAIEKSAKAGINGAITKAYHLIQKPDLFSGISRNYERKDEDGDQFPAELGRVQIQADQLLQEVCDSWSTLLNITAVKDYANTKAKADVVVDGTTIIKSAPTTYLIWLEKQLVDLHTLVSKLPTLDPTAEWHRDAASDTYATEVVQTTKTKKIPRNHVLAEATKEHPAQVQIFTEDVVVGYWNLVKFSGAIPQARVNELLGRVEELQKAVRFAREEANGIEVDDQDVGGPLFGYLLA